MLILEFDKCKYGKKYFHHLIEKNTYLCNLFFKKNVIINNYGNHAYL
jgi:hypothetical protein